MTDPTRHPSDPAIDRPVMGDHPELETDETRRYVPLTRGRDGRSPLVIAGIVALVILIVIVILLAII